MSEAAVAEAPVQPAGETSAAAPAPELEPVTPPEPEAEGQTPEPEAPEPDAEPEEPEEPKERPLSEIEAAYDRGEDITNAESRRREQAVAERAENERHLEAQTNFYRSVFPTAINGIVQDLQQLGFVPQNLNPQQQELLNNRLVGRLISGEGAIARHAKAVFEGPLVQLAAGQMVEAFKEAGMSEAEAKRKVFDPNFYFKDYIPELRKTLKSEAKPADTLEAVKKNFPKAVKAMEKEFHTKWPERGGNARPGSGGASGGKLTLERWRAMTPQERKAIPPEQEQAMIREAMGSRQ